MMTRAGLVWCALAVAAAVAAFIVKSEVRGHEARLADLEARIAASRDAVNVLKADWSYLNRPERLTALAGRHLGLVAMVPEQLTELVHAPLHRASVGGRPQEATPP